MLKKYSKKKIVCFGGGNAMPKVVLAEMKKRPVEITSITSMLENGGSTGQLRKDFNVLPAGDISRHLIALSEAPQWKRDLFYLRFGREEFLGGHKGHRFGTAFISLMEYVLKDFTKALGIADEFLEIKEHQALPATIQRTHLWAVLENEQIIKGEDEIDVPKNHDPKLKIKKVFLKPEVQIFSSARKAISEADMITFGPGDLYSSIVCCFLPKGMKEALEKTKANKVFICNAMTKLGETNGFTVLDFTREIERYLGCELDYVIYNNKFPSNKRIEKYKKQHPELLDLVKIDKNLFRRAKEGLPKEKFIGRNLLAEQGAVEYNPKKIVKSITELMF